jgi:hypothetical protein
MIFRGEDQYMPNIVMINNKSFFRDMGGSGAMGRAKKLGKGELKGVWGIEKIEDHLYAQDDEHSGVDDRFSFLLNTPMQIDRRSMVQIAQVMEHQNTLFERGRALITEDTVE